VFAIKKNYRRDAETQRRQRARRRSP